MSEKPKTTVHDPVVVVENLCNPSSARMPNHERINEFITWGHKLVEETKRLRSLLYKQLY